MTTDDLKMKYQSKSGYPIEYNEDVIDNSQCYCPMCGKQKCETETPLKITACEAVFKLAEMFEQDPILFEISMCKTINPYISIRDIASKLKRGTKTISKTIANSSKDFPTLGKFLKLNATNQYTSQQARRINELQDNQDN